MNAAALFDDALDKQPRCCTSSMRTLRIIMHGSLGGWWTQTGDTYCLCGQSVSKHLWPRGERDQSMAQSLEDSKMVSECWTRWHNFNTQNNWLVQRHTIDHESIEETLDERSLENMDKIAAIHQRTGSSFAHLLICIMDASVIILGIHAAIHSLRLRLHAFFLMKFVSLFVVTCSTRSSPSTGERESVQFSGVSVIRVMTITTQESLNVWIHSCRSGSCSGN